MLQEGVDSRVPVRHLPLDLGHPHAAELGDKVVARTRLFVSGYLRQTPRLMPCITLAIEVAQVWVHLELVLDLRSHVDHDLVGDLLDISFEGLVEVAAAKAEGSLELFLGIPNDLEHLLGVTPPRVVGIVVPEVGCLQHPRSQQLVLIVAGEADLVAVLLHVDDSDQASVPVTQFESARGVREGLEACLNFLLSS